MRLKSLLLGSAAALAATSANSADAIVIAGPEPVEYVRVCDAYGAGFFYIPGTETCLRVGGELRFQLGATDDADPFTVEGYNDVDILTFTGTDTANYHGFTEGGWNTNTRARIFFDARSETEWGTLIGYVRLQFDRYSGAAAYDVESDFVSSDAFANHAWLSLGGLRMGWSDSAFDNTPNSGYGANGSHSDDGLRYSAGQRNFIQYNFTGTNGVFATLSLEDDDADYYEYGTEIHDSRNYIPDVVVRAGVSQGWGAVWGAVGWDEDRTDSWSAEYDDVFGAPYTQVGESGWGVVAGAHLNVPNMPGSSLRVLGFYADSDNAYNPHGGEWSVLASYGHQFDQHWFVSVGGQYTDSLYLPGTDVDTTYNRYDIEGYVTWTPVENFQIMSEVVYSKQTDLDGSWSGFLRFSRFF